MNTHNAYVRVLPFYFLVNTAIAFAQAGTSDPCKGMHEVRTVLGGVAGGEINIREYLNDSLYFSDDCVNKEWGIVSFHLALKCNGNVLKYLENKNGNILTDEMKAAILELLPGCALTFDGIKTRSREKNYGNTYNEMNFGMLKFTLVQ